MTYVYRVFAVVVFLFSFQIQAAPQSLSYQGRILDSSQNPLEAASVQFRFTVLAPDGICELWSVTNAAINMTGSRGVFDQTIGPSASLAAVLENGVSHSCSAGGSYTGAASDSRKLKVEFNPNNTGWRSITPNLEINAVPYASMAEKSSVSNRIGSLAEADIISRSLAPVCVAANSFLQWNGTDFDCVAASVGGSGTVTNVTSTNAYLTVATGASTPALTVNVGTTAGTVAAGDDARFTDARIPTGTAGGDLSGTYPNPTLSNTGVTAGDYTKVTVDAKGRVTGGANLVAADIPNLDASKITTGTITNDVNNASTTSTTGLFGTASVSNLRLYDGASQYLVQVYPSGGTGYTITWPANQGAANTVLQNDGSGNLSWVVPPSAPVTSVAGRTGAVTLSNTDISGLGTSSTLNVAAAGNAAVGEVVKGDDTRLTDGRAPTGAAGGDLSGTYPNPTVAQIQGRAVNAAAPAGAGQALQWDGTEWRPNYIRAEDIRTAWGGTQMIPTASCSSDQAMVWSTITDRFTCQNIANLDAAAIASGVIAPAQLGTGTADSTTFLRGDGTWQVVSTTDNTKLPLAGGTMTGAINMGGQQITNVSNVPFVATNPAVGQDGQSLRWNNTSGQWEWFTAGAAGAGINTLNGQSGNSQSFAPSASATSYGFSSATDVHTLSIPSANSAGVTAGTISKAEYDAFNAKQPAGNYITDLTGDVTATGPGSAAATIANNAVTTAKVADSNITTSKIADANVTADKLAADSVTTAKILDGNVTTAKLSDSGVVAGQYPKVTVDNKGRVTAGAALDAADIPNLDISKITTGVLPITQGGTGAATANAALNNLLPDQSAEAGKVLSTDGTTTSWIAIPSAPVTSVAGRTGAVTLSNTDISGLGTSSTLNVAAAGNAAVGEVVKGDDTRLTDGRAPTGAAGGDLSGTYPNPTVAQIQGRAVNAAAPAGAGQALQWDGTEWRPNYIRAEDIRTAWGGTQMIPTASCSSDQAMVWSTITDRFTCQNIANLDAAAIASGVIAPAQLGTGTADSTTFLRGDGTWQTLSAGSGDVLQNGNAFGVPMVIGTNDSQPLSLETAGVSRLSISNNGTVIVGTDLGIPTRFAVTSNSTTDSDDDIVTFAASNNPSLSGSFVTVRSRGSLGSLAAVQAGDNLGGVLMTGWNGSTAAPAAGVSAFAETNFSVNNSSSLRLFTVDGGNTNSKVFISPGGFVAIGDGVLNPSTRLDLDGAFNQRGMADPGVSPAGQGRIYYSSSENKFKVSQNGGAYVDLVNSASGGLTSLNSQTGSTQTFAVDASGIAPAINSASDTHTLSIPLASGTGVTSGTISKTDYDSFVAKLTSPLTTKGDLLTRDGSDHIRLPAGTDGQVLAANSVTASGLEWRNLSVADISGTLPVANGGTGATTLGAGNLLVGNGTSPLDTISAGSAGNVLYASGISSWASGTPDTAGLVDKSSTQTLTGAKAFTNYIQMATQNAIRFADSDSTNYVAIRAPATVGTDVTLTLPATAGSNGQVLTTDGTGVLSWSSPSAGSSLGINTVRVAARFNEITANPPSGLLTVDGITLVAGDRVMINSPGFGNSGVWIAAAGSWTRASDLDNWSEAQGYRVYIKEGTVQKGRTFVADAPTAGSFAANELLWISEGTTSNNESAAASDSSVFFGYNVAPSITSSNSANVGIGPNALSSLTTGTYNIAIGRSPLQSVTTGNNNIGLGFASLVFLDTGYNNVSLGYQSGYNTTNGFENVYLGTLSGFGGSTAIGNIAIGESALYSNRAKRDTVAIGRQAMSYFHDADLTIADSYNTALGAFSLRGASPPFTNTNTGTGNTAVGYSALRTVSTGSNNLGVGYNAGSALTSGSNNVIIGSNTGSTIASSSNNILISDGAGSERIRVIADGNVGIGTANPRARLEVAGAIQVSLDAAACAAGRIGSIRLNGSSLEFCNGTAWSAISTGSVGTVTNVISANSYISISDNTTTPTITANVGTTANTLAAGDDSRFTDSRTPAGSAGGDLSGTYPNPTVSRIQDRAVASTLPIDGQALVWDNGLSTWRPDYIRAQDLRNAWGGTQMIPAASCSANQAMVWNTITDRFTCQNIANLDTAAIATGVIAPARLGTGTASSTTFLRGDGTWQTLAAGSGDILQNGNAFGAAMVVGTNDNHPLNFEANGTTRIRLLPNGYIGIGVPGVVPERTLDIEPSGGGIYAATSAAVSSPSAGHGVRIIQNNGADDQGYFYEVNVRNNFGNLQNAFIGAVTTTGSGFTPSIVFGQQTGATSYAERLRINEVGNVGIGTTSPDTTLHVAGQIKITGGSPGEGKVLTSDATGTASWVVPGAPRVVTVADSSTFTPTAGTADQNIQMNTQASGTLTMAAPTGTPVSGQKLIIRIKSTNVQTFSWNGIYRGADDLPLPTASSGATKTDYMGFIYNAEDGRWDLIASVFGF